jgi:tetratricopeptide (TPR) repeat protein
MNSQLPPRKGERGPTDLERLGQEVERLKGELGIAKSLLNQRAQEAVTAYRAAEKRARSIRVNELQKRAKEHYEAGEYELAMRALIEVLGIAIVRGDKLKQAEVHMCMGTIWEKKGDLSQALSHRRQTVSLAEPLLPADSDRLERYRQYVTNCQQELDHSRAKDKRKLAYQAYERNDYEESRQLYDEAAGFARLAGMGELEAQLLRDSAFTLSGAGAWEEAIARLQEALDKAIASGARQDLIDEITANVESFQDHVKTKEAWRLCNLSEEHYDKDRFVEAEEAALAALAEAKAQKLPACHFVCAVATYWLGLAVEVQGNSRAALKHYQQSCGFFRESKHTHAPGWIPILRTAIQRCVDDVGPLLGYRIRIQDLDPPMDD